MDIHENTNILKSETKVLEQFKTCLNLEQKGCNSSKLAKTRNRSAGTVQNLLKPGTEGLQQFKTC